MILIVKNRPPASFITYCQTPYGISFDAMDAAIKDELKVGLLNEQGWVCGYCQQIIRDIRRMKIEHYCEQTICNGESGTVDRRLDYTNLLAVCLGKAGFILHCDTSKATFTSQNGLPITLSPWLPPHINRINYHSTGRIDSTNKPHTDELNRILNLNADHLKNTRRTLWITLYSQCTDSHGNVNTEKMRRLAQGRSEKVGNRYNSRFPGLYTYMVRRFC